MKKFLSITLFLSTVLAVGQPGFMWTKQIGGKVHDEGVAIATDAAGNVVMAANIKDTVDADPGTGTQLTYGDHLENVYISKLTSAGNLVWAKRIGSVNGGYAHVTEMCVDSRDNITFSGYFTNTVDFDPGTGTFNLTANGGTDAFACKLDKNGNFIWAKSFGGTGNLDGTFVHGMSLTRNNEVLLTGSFKESVDFNPGSGTFSMTALGNGDAYVTKLDSMGNFIWALQFGDTSYYNVNVVEDCGWKVGTDMSDNVYVAGTFEGIVDFDGSTSSYTLQASSARADMFIIKLTPGGNFTWVRQLRGPDIELVNTLKITNAGEVYLTGLFEASVDVDPGPGTVMLNATTIPNSWYDVFLLKLDASGIYAWSKQLTGDMTKTADGLYIDNSGNILLTGTFYDTVDFDPGPSTHTITANSPTNIYILQLNPSGNFVWVYAMGGYFTILADMNCGKAITGDGAGNFYVTGKFAGPGDMDPTTGTYTLTTTDDYTDVFITKIGAPVGLIKNAPAENLLQVYPNPTSGTLKIKQQNTVTKVKVFNALGSEVMNSAFSNNEINLGPLPKGIYFVEVTSETGTLTRKIVKE